MYGVTGLIFLSKRTSRSCMSRVPTSGASVVVGLGGAVAGETLELEAKRVALTVEESSSLAFGAEGGSRVVPEKFSAAAVKVMFKIGGEADDAYGGLDRFDLVGGDGG